MEVANCFGQYLRLEKAKLNKINPKASLDFEKNLQIWKGLPEEEKTKFKKMSKQEKADLGDNYRKGIKRTPERCKDVKEFDRVRRRNERQDMKVKKEDDKFCSAKFRSILTKRETKYEKMVELNSSLEKEFDELASQNSELVKSLEINSDLWKIKYKGLFDEHSGCKRPDKL